VRCDVGGAALGFDGAVEQIYACPFCRQLFAKGEVSTCPECDITVKPLAELPESHEAQHLHEVVEPAAPEDERLPLNYLGRGRGMLLMIAVAGLATFFAPWYHESTPETLTWTGFEFARRLPWIWAGGVAWFVMLPLVASRRTVRQMRGARVAVGFLAAMVATTVLARLTVPVAEFKLVVLRYSWGWGLYCAGFLSIVAFALATRFGGSVEDMPTKRARRGDETLH
jgi:hypothetical protein